MSERLVCLVLTLLGLAAARVGESAPARSDERAVEAARKALDGRTPYPWYDPQTDRVRRIDVQPPPDSWDSRGSTWEKTPKRKKAASQPARGGGGGLFSTGLKVASWALLAALLLAIVALLVRAFLKRRASLADAGETPQSAAPSGEADRVENLPFRVRRPQADLLAEAVRHYEQGDYDEAIVYLFSYQLVQLDKHQLVHLARGKTNRQYLRELSPLPQLSQILHRTMIAFEDVFFGNRRLERDRFESCWRSLDDFHRLASSGP